MKNSHNDFQSSYVDCRTTTQEQANEQESGDNTALYTTTNLENNKELNQVQPSKTNEEIHLIPFDKSYDQDIQPYKNKQDNNADQLSSPFSMTYAQMKAEEPQINHRWFRKNKQKIRQAFLLFESILILKLINLNKYIPQDKEKKMSKEEFYSRLEQKMMFNKHNTFDKQSNAYLLFIKGINTVQSEKLITLDFLLFILRSDKFKDCFKKNLDDLESKTVDFSKIEGIRALKAIYDFAS